MIPSVALVCDIYVVCGCDYERGGCNYAYDHNNRND